MTVAASSECSPQRARQPCSARSSSASGLFGKRVTVPASTASRSAAVIACPVRSPTWRRRLRGRAAAAREAVAAPRSSLVNSTPSSSSQWMAEGASEVRISTSARSAVSCELRQMSSRVQLGRVVLADGGLDAALRLRGVAGLDAALRRERDARAGPLGGDGGGEAGGPAAEHEHVESAVGRQSRPIVAENLMLVIRNGYVNPHRTCPNWTS